MLRIAVISTPRSGNTWIRRLLATLYDLKEQGAPSPSEVVWDALPERYALQIHRHPEPDFLSLLEQHRFRVLVIARHPLDILISLLNYYSQHHDRSRCEAGASCPTCPVVGLSPQDPAFLGAFACGQGAADLFAYTLSWWGRSDVLSVKYEDLVDDTAGQLARLIAEIGLEPLVSLDEAVAANTLSNLRARYRDNYYHFWQGRPGLWKSLFPAAAARQIAAANGAMFDRLGYVCDPDESLEPAQAEAAWLKLQLSMREWNLQEVRQDLLWATGERQLQEANVKSLQATLDHALTELYNTRHALESLREAFSSAQAHMEAAAQSHDLIVAALQAQLAPFLTLDPLSLGVARRVHFLHRRYPRFSQTLFRLARRPQRTA
ncbi:MAG TPA: sulfotransferase domain-containing protein [Isosphaeraceae bacterium]|jgi:hypothetical protein|nr:sulfotransferase domain-containing protein [Isosphaeraceae bacterium]